MTFQGLSLFFASNDAHTVYTRNIFETYAIHDKQYLDGAFFPPITYRTTVILLILPAEKKRTK